MNFPKQVKTRSVVILLSCLLVLSSVSMYYAFSASTPTSGLTDIYIEPPMMESSYIIGIYTAPSTCYLKNGTSGQITTTGTFYYCLQAAVNYLTTGGKISIRSGAYDLIAGIVIETNNIWIQGEDEALSTTIRYNATGGLGAINYVGSLGWHYLGGISNIWFHGELQNNIYGLVVVGQYSDLVFKDCLFTNFDSAVVLYGGPASLGKIWNIWFTRCLFEDNLRAAINITHTLHATLASIDRIKISECHFYDNLNSIYCDAQYVWHVTLTDNTVQSERNACINVTSGGRQWIVTDNHIFDCGISANGTMAAIMVNGTGTFYPDSWLIENNIIANHFTSAPVAMNNSIWLTGTVTNFVIQGNFFFQASEPIRIDGLTSYSSIKVNGNADYAKNLVFPSEARAYSYLVGAFKSSYYMLNCSTGNVDYQGTNAATVFNYAFGNLTTGGKVLAKAGTYSNMQKIQMLSNTSLIGEGINRTVFVMTGNSVNWNGMIENIGIPSATNYNLEIAGISLDGNSSVAARTYNASCGIYMDGVENVWIHDCEFRHWRGYAVIFQAVSGTSTKPSKNLWIYNNYASDCEYNFFGAHSSSASINITNVNVYNNVVTYTDTGLSFQGNVIGVQCYGNMVYNNTNRIQFSNSVGIAAAEPSGTLVPSDVNVYGNTLYSNRGGIGAGDTGKPAYRVNVHDNMLWDNERYLSEGYGSDFGVAVFFVECKESIIRGNTILINGSAGHGIDCGGTDNLVDGNTVRLRNPSSWYPIYITSFNTTVSNNIVWNGDSYGICLSAVNNCTVIANRVYGKYYGVQLINTCNSNTIAYNTLTCWNGNGIIRIFAGSNNIVEHNTITGSNPFIDDAGGNLARWNIGYKTEGSASSNNATTTTWTFTIANATTLIRCYFSFNATVTDPFWSATGATLTITAGAIIAGNNTACYVEWYCWNYP